jgi:hypothetical protein
MFAVWKAETKGTVLLAPLQAPFLKAPTCIAQARDHGVTASKSTSNEVVCLKPAQKLAKKTIPMAEHSILAFLQI